MRESDFVGTSDPADLPTCAFCGHPGATRRSERNPGEFYCVEIWACIDRHQTKQAQQGNPLDVDDVAPFQ